MEIETLKTFFRNHNVKFKVTGGGNIKETLTKIFCEKDIKENKVYLICGSFFIMEETRGFFGFNEESDMF